MREERFVLTEDHLKLIRRMYVGWCNIESGAPEIDPKRPYGNSDVYFDMAKILGIPFDRESDTPFSAEVEKRFRLLHRSMETALQIVLRVGKFEAGIYEAEWSGGLWVRVGDVPATPGDVR